MGTTPQTTYTKQTGSLLHTKLSSENNVLIKSTELLSQKEIRIWKQWQEIVISHISTLALRSTQPPVNRYLKVISSNIGSKLSDHINNYYLLKNGHRQNITQLLEHYV
jgi:hypothetical protein